MSAKKSEEFVNRRGKHIAVTESDIDDSAIVQAKPKKHSRKRSRRHLVLPHIHLSRRAVIVVCILSAALVIASLVYTDSVKRDYERQTAAMKRSITDAGAVLPSTDTTASQVSSRLLTALSASTSCSAQSGQFVSWYGPAHQAKQQCDLVASQYKSLKSSLSYLHDASTYLEKVQFIFEPVLKSSGDSGYAVIGDEAASWSTAHDAIVAVSPPQNLSAIHSVLVQKTAAVKSAWEKLSSANSSQNADAFKTAEAELQQAYTGLRSGADEIRSATAKAQQDITTNPLIRK